MATILLLSSLGMVTLFTGVYNLRRLILPLVLLGLIAAFVINIMDWNVLRFNPSAHLLLHDYMHNMLRFDNYAIAFSGLLMGLTFLIMLLCDQYYAGRDSSVADIFALLLFTLVGGIMMASYYNLTMLFLGIETLSISLYILAGSRKLDLNSNEASLKYFLMGSFSTGFLLFGIALIFGMTNTFDLAGIKTWIDNYYATHNTETLPVMFKAGLYLMLVGLLFKVSAAPFHFWAPDVYHGSPTIITSFMATVAKTAAFAALLRLFYLVFPGARPDWFVVIWAVAALTIVIGNFSAVFQKSVKRMLAYSSVSNAGYLMMGVLALSANSGSAVLYYTAAYSIATITAFGVLMTVAKERGSDDYEAFHDLARKNPLLAGVMTVAMLSLAGIPPLAGFFGKYYIFLNSLDSNDQYWLVIIAVIGSLIGIYYYFKVIVAMFTAEPEMEKIPLRGSLVVMLLIGAAALVVLGLFPQLLSDILL